MSPASLLAFWEISGTKTKGARGEKTRARSRTSGFEPIFWKNERIFAVSVLSAKIAACLGSEPSDIAPEAIESPQDASINVPVESQNGGVNAPESEVSEPSNEAPISEPVQAVSLESAPPASASQTPQAPQPQSPAQQDQTGFIRVLLAKAQAKIQFNKRKKLDKIILFAQKKKIVVNEDIQKLLHVSSATATRYLVKLVQQGRLARVVASTPYTRHSCSERIVRRAC